MNVTYDLLDYRDLQTGLFVMNCTVGFTVSIAAQMILAGKITKPGVLSTTASFAAIARVLSPGLSAAGYSSVMGNQVKEGIPWATFTGLTALPLAEQGLTGPTDILDHPGYIARNRSSPM